MNRQTFLIRKLAVVAVAAASVLFVAACAEDLDSENSCPLLCPSEAIGLVDTIFPAVVFDTTVTGIPPIGSEDFLVLAQYGDSLETRVIVRYDSIQPTFSHGGLDSTITRVDSAFLRLTQTVDTLHKPTAPVTIELYDVDTPATDTVASVLLPLFTPSRLLGSRTYTPDSLKDTLQVPLSNSAVLERIANGKRLRIGMRLVTANHTELRLQSTLSGSAPTLHFRVSADTAVAAFNVTPLSKTPTDTLSSFLTSSLSDYVILAQGASRPPSLDVVSVGGLPVKRGYIRFNLPSNIVDSSTIVRATLLLTQKPTPKGVRRGDTINVFPVAIVASPTVTDIGTALSFLTAPGTLGLTASKVTPGDSGVRQLEVVALLKAWKGVDPKLNPRVMALQSANENETSGEITFFSTRAAASVRPRLRITYVPRAAYGVP